MSDSGSSSQAAKDDNSPIQKTDSAAAESGAGSSSKSKPGSKLPASSLPKGKEAKAYKSVVRGGLKLKSGQTGLAKTIDKTKKTKKRDDEFIKEQFQEFLADREKKEKEKAAAALEDTRTAAEKQFEEATVQREKAVIKKKIAKSHRQRIADFNNYLDKLSEHYDIPRVGPG